MGSELSGNGTSEYCRDIETYLCRKNDGHLIRVVGPSFDLVSGWAARGIPLKVAFTGIDRCFERYHRRSPRRRPLKIDFCDADVLDAFDEWRRAVGLSAGGGDSAGGEPERNRRRQTPSLPAHLERVVTRLTAARANGRLLGSFDSVIDAVARELDIARGAASGLRGDARQALIARLATLDVELLQAARASLDERSRAALMNDAEGEIARFRDRMAPAAFERAREAACDRLIRASLGLPVVVFP
jgi:hypothetical protein